MKFNTEANLPIEMFKKGTTYTVKTYYESGDQKVELEDVSIDSDEYVGKTEGAKIDQNYSFAYTDEIKDGVPNNPSKVAAE